ncbi:hypothetical protein H4Q26_012779 [Puccinia striiformis f. sp. tritici PST-130]|nr:hypothetical protein H4Q26_012779 [Puccinia striiformis f. sp. tritici PST-130]
MIRVQSSDLEQESVYIYVSKYLTGFRVNRKSPPKKITNQHSTTNNPRTVIYKNPFKKDEDFPSGSDNNDEYQLRHEFDNQFRGLKLYNP